MAHTIETPYAAIKIWNYQDRIDVEGANPYIANQIKEEIISTLSLVNIQTTKSKGDPVGTFNFTLAPTRNWVSVITPGSWCVILMSNNPITEKSLKIADASQVKMFGRINSVRVEVSVDDEGTRQTRYLVSGEDWGSIFNNVLYIDPLISDPKEQPNRQGNSLYVQILEYLLSRDNTPSLFVIKDNLKAILSVFGKPIPTPQEQRLGKPTHHILIPNEALNFFNFINEDGVVADSTDLTKIIALQTGALNTEENKYDTSINDGSGWINAFSLVGQHSLWSILMDNCNHALNEMYTDFRWINQISESKPQLTLYSRIRPFSFQNVPVLNIDNKLRSNFLNITTHTIDTNLVNSINAGTNWKDKYNFIEIKPEIAEFSQYDKVVKLKSQAYQRFPDGAATTDIFDREGFRPLIFSIKQIPLQIGADTADNVDVELINKWVNMLQEWYFDSHRLLNGRITMTGSTEYIPVGDNILFDAELVGISHNYNSASPNEKCFILAHVESIQHTFAVGTDGARHFQTTIQFVRGIVVNENKQLIGEGTIDLYSNSLSKTTSRNSITTFASSTKDDPEKES